MSEKILIQRMLRKPDGGNMTINGQFRMDPMVSPEFQTSVVRTAIIETQAFTEALVVAPVGAPSSLWYVGRSEELEVAETILCVALDPNTNSSLAEDPYIREMLIPLKEWGPDVGFLSNYIGWFVLNPKPPFAVFLSESDAHLWKKVLAVDRWWA